MELLLVQNRCVHPGGQNKVFEAEMALLACDLPTGLALAPLLRRGAHG